MSLAPIPQFALLIDTDKNAGNFERKLCAFCTGMIGQCQVGDEEADLFIKEYPRLAEQLIEYICVTPSDDGCPRPVTIWLSPGSSHVYKSVAILFEKEPTTEMVATIKSRAAFYCGSNQIIINSYRLLKFTFKTEEVSLPI